MEAADVVFINDSKNAQELFFTPFKWTVVHHAQLETDVKFSTIQSMIGQCSHAHARDRNHKHGSARGTAVASHGHTCISLWKSKRACRSSSGYITYETKRMTELFWRFRPNLKCVFACGRPARASRADSVRSARAHSLHDI